MPYFLLGLAALALGLLVLYGLARVNVTALVRLTPITHDAAVALAELPDEIRGYEQVKLDNVTRFREKAKQLTAQLN